MYNMSQHIQNRPLNRNFAAAIVVCFFSVAKLLARPKIDNGGCGCGSGSGGYNSYQAGSYDERRTIRRQMRFAFI